MSELLGVYDVCADERYRIIVPSRFRQALGREVSILGLDEGCLALCKSADEHGISNGSKIRYITQNVAIENNGAIYIPQILLEHARLDDGQKGLAIWFPNRAEIWEKGKWENYFKGLELDKKLTLLREKITRYSPRG